jgi:chromosome segregation ATPase
LIEAVMYFVLGVLVAGILALAVAPAIWRRAARLTRARVEASLPMTLGEIRAEKDQLRAEFAVATRRLETTIGRLEERTTEQTIDIGRKRTEIERLAAESAGRAEAIRQLEERAAGLDVEKAKLDERVAALVGDIAARDATLAERADRIATLGRELESAIQTTEEQQLELIARNTEIGNLKDEIAAARIAHSALSVARDQVVAALGAEQASLAAEKQNAERLAARIAALELERTDRVALLDRRAAEIREHEAEIARERAARESLAAEASALEARRREHAEAAERHAIEIERLKAEIATAGDRQRDLEARVAAAETAAAEARTEASGLAVKAAAVEAASGDNMQKSLASLEADRSALAERLARIEEEAGQLRNENAELRRVAGADWESERLENGRLREKLAAIAADVVRMAEAASGAAANGTGAGEEANGAAHPTRPSIRAVGSDEPPPPREEAPPTRPAEGGKSLAERIRALQHAGSRH